MARYLWCAAHVRQPMACSPCPEAWSRSARRSRKPGRARCTRRQDWQSNRLRSPAFAKPSSAMRKAGSSGISSSCALPPAGARASLSSTRNSTRRAGSTRPSSRACRRPPASPTSWPRRSIASPNRRRPERPTRSVFAISAHSGGSASPVEVSAVVGGDERTEVACKRVTRMPFFRRLAPQQCLNKCGPPHLGFMSAQILHPMLRRVLLAAAGATARAEAGVAPFDGSLQRLAEILGALHYLRNICGANEGQKWRNEMQSLVDAEAPSGERRARMIASFNRGYRGYQQSYRTCTPAADLVIRRYLEEGSKIAREMTARYAN